MATWSPLRIAAALRMHSCIAFLLQQGRLDPDDRVTFPATEIVAVIAASTATPAELPWKNALPVCNITINLVRDALFGWDGHAHWLYHSNVKKAVFAVLVVADRLEREYDDFLEEEYSRDLQVVEEEEEEEEEEEVVQVGGNSNADTEGANGTTVVAVTLANHEASAAAPAECAPLPLLPPEIWLFIMHFFQRSWWDVI